MKLINQYLMAGFSLLILSLAFPQMTKAHLMVAQHGTLNFLNDDIYMVLSVSINAFDGIDDNIDGEVSMIEFNNHRDSIIEQIKAKVSLTSKEEYILLEGIMLSPVVPHGHHHKAISQLTIMGKYTLKNTNQNLSFQTVLYGKSHKEQVLRMTATHRLTNQKHVFELTPDSTSMTLFSNIRS